MACNCLQRVHKGSLQSKLKLIRKYDTLNLELKNHNSLFMAMLLINWIEMNKCGLIRLGKYNKVFLFIYNDCGLDSFRDNTSAFKTIIDYF